MNLKKSFYQKVKYTTGLFMTSILLITYILKSTLWSIKHCSPYINVHVITNDIKRKEKRNLIKH